MQCTIGNTAGTIVKKSPVTEVKGQYDASLNMITVMPNLRRESQRSKGMCDVSLNMSTVMPTDFLPLKLGGNVGVDAENKSSV